MSESPNTIAERVMRRAAQQAEAVIFERIRARIAELEHERDKVLFGYEVAISELRKQLPADEK